MTALRLPSDQDASGRSFGEEERSLLTRVLQRGTLTSTKGPEGLSLEGEVARLIGVGHCTAASSGTAAIHAAIAAVDPEPGDEIVTSPITDMGGLAPMLYQGAIPRFADVDAATGNVTAETVEAVLSDRTRAVVVTHLFGTPCRMGPIEKLANARGVPIIEDCAQAWLARVDGRTVGSIGALACFSTQQGKQLTSGEGGFVLTDDEALARRMRLFVNKGWPYGESEPDHEFLALNYRMTELQAAVARAQLAKLEGFVEQRRRTVAQLEERLADVDGVRLAPVREGDEASYWRVALLIDDSEIAGGPDEMASALARMGVASAPRYIRKPAFACRVFTEKKTFGNSGWPFTLAAAEATDYSPDRFAGTFAFLDSVLVLPWNERYLPEHVAAVADAVAGVAQRLSRGG